MASVDSNTKSDGLMESLVQVRRTSKMTKGGRSMQICACAVVGDGKGRVGFGTGEDKEVPQAVSKALSDARKNMVHIQLNSGTLFHRINCHFGATKVLMQPASEGTGIIAGGAMRAVFEVVGVKNVLAKIYGSTNPINVVRATLKALLSMSSPETIAEKRGLSLTEIKANYRSRVKSSDLTTDAT